MAVSEVVDLILKDNGLSDTAARMALLIARRAGGDWCELSPGDFARALAGYPSAEKVARHLKQLDVAGYIERKAGGRGHSDSFRISPAILAPASIPDLKIIRSGIHSGPNDLDPVCEGGLSRTVVEEADVAINPHSPPADLDERTAAVVDRLNGCRGAIRDYLLACVPTSNRRYAYAQTVRAWLNGADPGVWRMADGAQLPPDERPPMLAATLNELAAGEEQGMKRPIGDPANLRTKLNINLKKRSDYARANGTNGGRTAGPGGGKAASEYDDFG